MPKDPLDDKTDWSIEELLEDIMRQHFAPTEELRASASRRVTSRYSDNRSVKKEESDYERG